MFLIMTVATDMADTTGDALGIARMVGGILLVLGAVFIGFNIVGGILRSARDRRSVKKVKRALQPEKEKKDPEKTAYSYSAKRLEGEKRERERMREERRTQWERERKKNDPRG